MFSKYQRDMEALEKAELQNVVEAVIFGRNNKKRKRDEVEGLDQEEGGGRRKMKMMEERLL